MRSPRILTALVALLCVTGAASAQNITGLPRVSPHATSSQTIGLAEVSVDYHRPSVNDREIWGGLVPYDVVWRAGANDNTTITFSHDATVEGQPLAAGTYGLHMIPGEETWTVILSTNSTSWGSFSYDEAEDALRVEVTPTQAQGFQEQLVYGFDDVSDSQATFYLQWADLRLPIQLAFDTPALAIEHIQAQLRHIPGFSWQGFNSAAAYCLNSGNDLEQGLAWADRSIGMDRNATNLFIKSSLLRKLERDEEATEIEAAAFEIASEAEINGFGYNYLYQQSDVEAAIRVFKRNVANYPDSWNVYDSLGEAYAVRGDTELAVENYRKALEMAPEAQHARIEQVLAGLES